MSRSLAPAKEARGHLALVSFLPKINALHRSIYNKTKEVVREAVEIGNLLLKLKALTPHGHFEDTLDNNPDCEVSLRTAQKYMQLAKGFPQLEEQLGSVAYEMSIEACISKLNRGVDQKRRPRRFSADQLTATPDTTSSPVDGGGDSCIRGGQHEYDEEACVKCHDPRPTEGEEGRIEECEGGAQGAAGSKEVAGVVDGQQREGHGRLGEADQGADDRREGRRQNGQPFNAEAEIKAFAAAGMRLINLLNRYAPNEKLRGECVQSMECLYEDLRTWKKRMTA